MTPWSHIVLSLVPPSAKCQLILLRLPFFLNSTMWFFFVLHRTNCEPKEMPGFHFVQHKLTRTDCSDAKKQKWQLIEHAAACGSSLWARKSFKSSYQYPDNNVVRTRPLEIKHIWNNLLWTVVLLRNLINSSEAYDKFPILMTSMFFNRDFP